MKCNENSCDYNARHCDTLKNLEIAKKRRGKILTNTNASLTYETND